MSMQEPGLDRPGRPRGDDPEIVATYFAARAVADPASAASETILVT